MLPEGSLDGIHVFFPDPWHKTRHKKRRLIQPPFVALLASRLKPGGYFHCATDWENYALQMLDVLSRAEPGQQRPGPTPRPGRRARSRQRRRPGRLRAAPGIPAADQVREPRPAPGVTASGISSSRSAERRLKETSASCGSRISRSTACPRRGPSTSPSSTSNWRAAPSPAAPAMSRSAAAGSRRARMAPWSTPATASG
jgi:hypothetical protein